MQIKRKTINDIISLKSKGTPIVCLTSYNFPQSKILDDHCDVLLVGDSLGMVVYGYESTLPVTVDLMIQHGKAVVKGSRKALVVIDMPFGSYENSAEEAYTNCKRVIEETGADAVKLEGGIEMAPIIKHLIKNGIKVMGHVGMQPQSINKYGGFFQQGKDEATKNNIVADAKAIENAGVFSFVLEHVTPETAKAVVDAVQVPVIGIGAGNVCDGQVLVTEDMLGLFEKTPKFVKKFADIKQVIEKATELYSSEVRSRKFPDNKQ